MGCQAFIGFLDLVLDLFNLMGFVFTYFVACAQTL